MDIAAFAMTGLFRFVGFGVVVLLILAFGAGLYIGGWNDVHPVPPTPKPAPIDEQFSNAEIVQIYADFEPEIGPLWASMGEVDPATTLKQAVRAWLAMPGNLTRATDALNCARDTP